MAISQKGTEVYILNREKMKIILTLDIAVKMEDQNHVNINYLDTNYHEYQ